MIFHEIYGSYYRAVSKILTSAVRGELSHEEMERIAHEEGFAESFLTILPALREQRWQLLCDDFSTPLKHEPTMPLTALQRRWLKTVSLDPRARLFWEEIFDHQPLFFETMPEERLFLPEDYVIFDQYGDGDPYGDEKYIENFRTVAEAVRSKRELWIRYRKGKGGTDEFFCRPYRMEYSEKDDKFRAYIVRGRFSEDVINIGRIEACSAAEEKEKDFKKRHTENGKEEGAERAIRRKKPKRVFRMSDRREGAGKQTERADSDRGDSDRYDAKHAKMRRRNVRYIVMELTDERNALERAMLHFAHFRKEAERMGENRYRIRVWYDRNDETELLIRVLSFGPFIRVTEPLSFVSLIKERLRMQSERGLL